MAADLESRIEEFELAWHSGERPLLSDYLLDEIAGDLLQELIVIDLDNRWRTNDRDARIEDYFDHFESPPAVPAALLVEEYRIRRRYGDRPVLEEYLRRFGDQRADIAEQLATVDRELLAESPDAATFGTKAWDDTDTHNAIGVAKRTELSSGSERYQLHEELGKGGMGTVRRAFDTLMERFVAYKTPLAEAGDDRIRERFLREARAAAKVEHSNICPIYDVGETGGQPYITMALIDGKPLDAAIADASIEEKVEVFAKVADALGAAHQAGIVHRDLKPSNVLIDEKGEPIVMDFGLAHLHRPTDEKLTQSGTMIGTPAYMSPEQIDGAATDARSDIFSLGVMLYESVAGKHPFAGTFTETLLAVAHDDPPLLSSVHPDVDESLAAICAKMIAKKPRDRFASMSGVAAALRTDLAAKPVTKPRSASRKRTAIIASVVGIALLAAILVFRIATDNGTVVIKSEVPVEVSLNRDGKPIRSWMLKAGENKIEIGTGDVTVQFKGTDKDRFTISDDKLTLTRGEKVVFAISRKTQPPKPKTLKLKKGEIDESQWRAIGKGRASFTSKKIKLSTHKGDEMVVFRGRQPKGSQGIEATAFVVSGDRDAVFGVVFRFVDQKNYAALQLQPKGRYRLLEIKGGKIHEVKPWTDSPVISRYARKTNILQVRFAARETRFLINNRQVASAALAKPTAGSFGFLAEGLGLTVDYQRIKLLQK